MTGLWACLSWPRLFELAGGRELLRHLSLSRSTAKGGDRVIALVGVCTVGTFGHRIGPVSKREFMPRPNVPARPVEARSRLQSSRAGTDLEDHHRRRLMGLVRGWRVPGRVSAVAERFDECSSRAGRGQRLCRFGVAGFS